MQKVEGSSPFSRSRRRPANAGLFGLGASRRRAGWTPTAATRPVVIFVCPDAHTALAHAAEADRAMTGRLGPMGTPAHEWYYAGRDHVFFAVEPDIHRGSLAALALPQQPPAVRARLTGSDELHITRVTLLSNAG